MRSRADYKGFMKDELISQVLKLEDMKEYYQQQKEISDKLIYDQKEIIEELKTEVKKLKASQKVKREAVGRPKLGQEVINDIIELCNMGYTQREIAIKLKISKTSVLKYDPRSLSRYGEI